MKFWLPIWWAWQHAADELSGDIGMIARSLGFFALGIAGAAFRLVTFLMIPVIAPATQIHLYFKDHAEAAGFARRIRDPKTHEWQYAEGVIASRLKVFPRNRFYNLCARIISHRQSRLDKKHEAISLELRRNL